MIQALVSIMVLMMFQYCVGVYIYIDNFCTIIYECWFLILKVIITKQTCFIIHNVFRGGITQSLSKLSWFNFESDIVYINLQNTLGYNILGNKGANTLN